MTIHILSHSSEHTTARYFERAARAMEENDDVIYWASAFNIEALSASDFLLLVDPPPDLPLGLEAAACPTAAYFIDVHQDLNARVQLSKLFDYIFVPQKDYVSSFMCAGHSNVHWLPLACEPAMHSLSFDSRSFELSFVGKLGAPETERYRILSSILPKYHTNDYLRYYRPTEMASVYSQARIVLNASINGDLNMRFFEALASGAMLLTDRIGNGLQELFEEGTHYVGYSTVDEALTKIDYYLSHERECREIAAAGHALVTERDTYCNRWTALRTLCSGTVRESPARGLSRGELADLYSRCFANMRRPGRMPAVLARYGLGGTTLQNVLASNARWLNARIPLSPNALKAWLQTKE